VERDVLFIGHANPSSNQEAEWLALQLARQGYKVWSDVTSLIGGQPIWGTIDELIREHVVKYIFILTNISNVSEGCEKELQLADNAKKKTKDNGFIIPCRFDDINSTDLNSYIARQLYHNFTPNWGDGLVQLSKDLQRCNVPRPNTDGPNSVSDWWQEHFKYSAEKTLVQKAEKYKSNCFPITHIPSILYLYEFNVEVDTLQHLNYPYVPLGRFVATFAHELDLSETSVLKKRIYRWESFDDRKRWEEKFGVPIRSIVTNLLRQAWESKAKERGLVPHEMSRSTAFVFTGENRKLTIKVPRVSNKVKTVVGQYKFTSAWHLAFRLRPVLSKPMHFVLKVHILFSNDGINIWESSSELFRARRSHCKRWFNDKWRDLTTTAIDWIADNNPSFDLSVGPKAVVKVSTSPLAVESKYSYLFGDDFEQRIEDVREDEDFEDVE